MWKNPPHQSYSSWKAAGSHKAKGGCVWPVACRLMSESFWTQARMITRTINFP